MNRRSFLQWAGSLVVASQLRIEGRKPEEGDERTFEQPDGTAIKCRLVRNLSGKTLMPNRFVKYGKNKSIAGYASGNGGIEDLWKIAGVTCCGRNGVENGRLFWLGIQGSAKVKVAMPKEYISV